MGPLRRLCRNFATWDTAVMVGIGLIVIGIALYLALPGCASSTQIDGASSSAKRTTTTTRTWEWGQGAKK